MSKTYIALALIVVLVAVGLLFLPEHSKYVEINPKLLIKEINDPARFLSVDQVAERLIDEDPSIMLIDVRTPERYKEYSLPRTINIPLDQLLDSAWKDYLNQDNMDVILYSNSDLYADQAWIICTRLGYKNLYVMKGGINEWYSCIFNPSAPAETAPNEEFALYSFRLAASQYFGGSTDLNMQTDKPKENIVIKKRQKKTITAGGC